MTIKKLLVFLTLSYSLTSMATATNAGNPCTEDEKRFEHKVNVCHVPSGDHTKAFVICVDYNGANTHLGIALDDINPNIHAHKHHDYLGTCEGNQLDQIWLCDAALKHEKHNTENEVCTGNSCMSTIDTNHNFEEITFKISDYFQGVEPSYTRDNTRASGTHSFNKSSTHLGEHILSNVAFHLNSERIGSEYYVDVCWKNKKENTQVVSLEVVNQIAQSHQGIPYIDMVSLERKTDILCSKTDSFDDLFPVKFGTYAQQGLTSMIPFYSLRDSQITNCVVRQYFREKRIASREIRHNKFKSIAVSSTVRSDVQVENDDETKLVFCQVETEIPGNGPKAYNCIQNVMTNDTLRNYLGSRNQNNKDYTGLCQNQKVGPNVKCGTIAPGIIE